MKLVVASRNPHKTREFAEILGDEFEISDVSNRVDIPNVDETGETFEENAVLKAVAVSRYTKEFVIGDDSGLEVDALGGAPGLYSARYSGAGATDERNIAKLQDELANCCHEQRTARFRCVIALARDGELMRTFDGVVEGVIIDVPRGDGGFGYDPVFRPNGFEQTLAELPTKVKNQISHRGKAAEKLARFFRERD